MATPKILPYEVELRAVRLKRNLSRPVVYTNDLNSAEFQFKVIDMDAGDLSTATATTLLYMRDGSFFQNPKEDVSLVGTTFSYTLKENEGNHAGIAKIQLVVYFNEGLANEQNFPTQLYEFEIINGLETKVAQEVMIYDWTTLTRDARAYIDQFVADEVFRDAQFDNAQFDRNVAFVGSQESRALAFGVEQTDRGEAFTTEQTDRNTAFNNAQDARDLTFSESESGRTTAESGRVTAESNRVIAESGRVTKESQRVTAETNRVTAEGNRVTAESGRVTAESGRVTAETNRAAAFTAFDTRLTAEETATAANKISAVKSKTFADVDARIEDVEFDTTLMATNLAVNGDFSNGVSSWSTFAGTTVAGEYKFDTGVADFLYQSIVAQSPSKFYFAMKVYGGGSIYVRMYNLSANQLISDTATVVSPSNGKSIRSGVLTATGEGTQLRINRVQDTGLVYIDDVILINLTATFGKGNEPTAEQMDGIMGKFPNSWFNGTANLFRANAALNKLMAVDARTEFEAKNLLLNTDFTSGASNWTFVGFADMGDYISGTEYRAYQSIASADAADTDKVYVRAKARLRGASGNLTLLFTGSTFATIAGTAIDTWYEISGISTNRTSRVIQIASSAGASTIDIYKKSVVAINLTRVFGAGKEPTLAEMDRLMARFPNSWFDGVKPIQTIETLYQEKANKVQEAWITPTLQNGATGDIQYRKNQQGRVEFRGSITFISDGLAVLTMPVGYRLAASATFSLAVPSTASTTSTQRNMFLNGGANWYPGYPLTARTIDFTGLSYVAEQ